MRQSIFILFLLLWCLFAGAQEICDNGIDDNNNGLVDMNDFTCRCNMAPLYPVNKIVNPSLEATFDLPGPYYIKNGDLKGWFQPGGYGNKAAPEGNYVWMIEYTGYDNKSDRKSGSFLLLR
jgi:hypothetical protein